jgi:hypothetical protein
MIPHKLHFNRAESKASVVRGEERGLRAWSTWNGQPDRRLDRQTSGMACFGSSLSMTCGRLSNNVVADCSHSDLLLTGSKYLISRTVACGSSNEIRTRVSGPSIARTLTRKQCPGYAIILIRLSGSALVFGSCSTMPGPCGPRQKASSRVTLFHAACVDGDVSAVRTLHALQTTKLLYESFRRRIVLEHTPIQPWFCAAEDGFLSCPI